MSDALFQGGFASKAPSPYIILIAACVAYILLYGLYNLTLHPLRSYPGPLLWRAYRFPYARSLLAGRFPYDVHKIHEKYGPVVRVAPGELCYVDSRALKAIYGHHNASEGFSEFDKDRMEAMLPLNGTWSILSAPAVDHSRYRRLFSHAFSEKGMREMQPRIQYFVELLIKRLKETTTDEEGKNSWQNIEQWYNWTTFDMIGDLAFGQPFGCLEQRKTDPWIAAIFGNVKAAPFLAMMKHYNLIFLQSYITPKKLSKSREVNMRRTEKLMENRIQMGSNRGDFWDNVIEKSDFEKGTGMTKPEMDSNSALLVLGGSETTATLLAGTTYLLLKNPEVMKKLNKEVREAFKSEEEIDLLSVGKLEYMLAVLDEAMRLYPPVPNQNNRVVPPSGAMVAGKWVPGGTSLQVSQYAANYSSANFTRPLDFAPERWLPPPNQPSEFAKDDRAARAPFSLGPRNCIGRNLAYAEMRLILAKVCFNFDLELDEERCGNWIKVQKIYSLWEKGPLWVKLRMAEK